MKAAVIIFLVIALAFTVHAGQYCPKPPNIQCFVHNNQCCSIKDCEKGELCCVDTNCGNSCRTPEDEPVGGTRVDEDDHTCQKGIPTPGEKCDGINETWVKCSKPKWCNTCDIRGNCKLTECTPGCDCKENHFRDDNGKCIPSTKCPKVKPIGGYCPKSDDNIRCFVYYNQCCSKKDCEKGELCCVDKYCGNTCRNSTQRQDGGTRVDEDDNTCQIGIPTPGLYCPKKLDIACAQTGNTCCNDGDCKKGKVCCKEACGSQCRSSDFNETNGEKYSQTPEVCQKNVFTNF